MPPLAAITRLSSFQGRLRHFPNHFPPPMKQAALFLAAALAVPVNAADKVVSVEFTATPAPRTESEMAASYTRSSAIVGYASGAKKVYPLTYEVLFRSGDQVGSGFAGLVVDKDGKALAVSPADDKGRRAQGPFHAYAPDANSLIRQDGKLYLVTQYEYHTEAPAVDGQGSVQLYGQLPGAMNLATLVQDRKTGKLAARELSNIDMAPVGGLWIPCAASLTPWNTHLAGEEYEPNARQFEFEALEPMNLFLGTPGKTANEGGADPYRYGHPVEVAIGGDGKPRVHKRYAMGRLSAELAQVMPDERTAYMGDDGRDTMMFMFVADRPRDLSAGTLYAGRWEQVSAEDGGLAGLKWIRLGHAREEEIKAMIERGIRFSDIFEAAGAAAVKADPARHEGYRPVYVYEGQAGKSGAGAKPGVTYLKLKPGMEQAAAFLESRRYGALLGATSEFTKMEGVTLNPEQRKLYYAMSYIEAGMIDGQNGERPQDHIRLKGDPKDLACGAVYESALAAGQKDSGGAAIDSGWVATDMRALLLGAKKPFGQNAYGKLDKCDTDRLANPDNLKYSPEMRTLFIGEDSGAHLNNFLWAYNVDSGSLTRILSAPAGAEHTGLAIAASLDGHGYIFSNVQHPGAWKDLKAYPDSIRVELRNKVDQRGAVGYLWGLPALER